MKKKIKFHKIQKHCEKKKRECLLWNDQYTIKNISFPEEIKATEKLKKNIKYIFNM